MQNVFMKLYRYEKDFAGEEDCKRWLLRVTVNECHSLFRSLLDVTYGISGELSNRANWGQPDIHLNVGELFDYQQKNVEKAVWDAETQIGEIKVHYIESRMYVVAPDYELTDEDLKMLQDENIPIVTGLKAGKKPQLKTIASCCWTMDAMVFIYARVLFQGNGGPHYSAQFISASEIPNFRHSSQTTSFSA